MATLPIPPTPGANVPRGWMLDFYNAVMRFMKNPVVGDGKTIRVEGNRISVIRQSGGSPATEEGGGMTPVKITSGSGADHVGNVYGNGIDTAATETGVTIKVLQIATGAVIPANTYLWATKIKWSGTKQWTVDVPRWL